jgi:mono/diheme cytochrome c family protein
MRRLVYLTVGLAMLGIASCASPSTTPTPASTTTGAGSTAGEMAALGWAVYGRSCVGCHGPKAAGRPAPALIGADNKLSRHMDAQGLMDFISSEMPVNRPGELAVEEYQQLLAMLLVENKVVQRSTVLDFDALGDIPLK